MEEEVLLFKRLHSNAIEPAQAHSGDAGFDLAAVESSLLYSGQSALIRTGVAVQLPWGTVGLVHPRSGLAARHQITVLNAPGVIDEGYVGEILVNLINHGHAPYRVEAGERIAQLIIQDYRSPVVIEQHQLVETSRGTNGHGSTGR